MLYQRSGVVTEESPPISVPDDIDPKGASSVPRHRMGRCCGAVRSAPKPGRPKLAQVPFRPNSLQAPLEQNWVAPHGWPEEIHPPTCRDEIPEPRLTNDTPPRDLLYLSNKSVKPAAHHKSGALGSTPPPEDRLQKKKENHSGTMLLPPPPKKTTWYEEQWNGKPPPAEGSMPPQPCVQDEKNPSGTWAG